MSSAREAPAEFIILVRSRAGLESAAERNRSFTKTRDSPGTAELQLAAFINSLPPLAAP